MQPASKRIRVTAFVDEQDYLDIRRDLISRRMSFSAWVRQQITTYLRQDVPKPGRGRPRKHLK